MDNDPLNELTEILAAAGGPLTLPEVVGRMAGGPDADAVSHLLDLLRIEGAVRHQADGRWIIARGGV